MADDPVPVTVALADVRRRTIATFDTSTFATLEGVFASWRAAASTHGVDLEPESAIEVAFITALTIDVLTKKGWGDHAASLMMAALATSLDPTKD